MSSLYIMTFQKACKNIQNSNKIAFPREAYIIL